MTFTLCVLNTHMLFHVCSTLFLQPRTLCATPGSPGFRVHTHCTPWLWYVVGHLNLYQGINRLPWIPSMYECGIHVCVYRSVLYFFLMPSLPVHTQFLTACQDNKIHWPTPPPQSISLIGHLARMTGFSRKGCIINAPSRWFSFGLMSPQSGGETKNKNLNATPTISGKMEYLESPPSRTMVLVYSSVTSFQSRETNP